jgi:hypothetical protein
MGRVLRNPFRSLQRFPPHFRSIGSGKARGTRKLLDRPPYRHICCAYLALLEGDKQPGQSTKIAQNGCRNRRVRVYIDGRYTVRTDMCKRIGSGFNVTGPFGSLTGSAPPLCLLLSPLVCTLVIVCILKSILGSII